KRGARTGRLGDLPMSRDARSGHAGVVSGARSPYPPILGDSPLNGAEPQAFGPMSFRAEPEPEILSDGGRRRRLLSACRAPGRSMLAPPPEPGHPCEA